MEYTVDVGNNVKIDWSASGPQRIVQNVSNICKLFRYEAAYARTMGMDPGFLHKPAPIAQSEIAAQITEQVALYEPRAKVKQVIYSGVGADGDMAFKVVIEV